MEKISISTIMTKKHLISKMFNEKLSKRLKKILLSLPPMGISLRTVDIEYERDPYHMEDFDEDINRVTEKLKPVLPKVYVEF